MLSSSRRETGARFFFDLGGRVFADIDAVRLALTYSARCFFICRGILVLPPPRRLAPPLSLTSPQA